MSAVAASPTPVREDRSVSAPSREPASETRRNPRALIASGWHSDSRPPHLAFRLWTEAYLAADGPARETLVAEGLRLAELRREALARLIVGDPEAALASAAPLTVRAALPAEVAARLEARVSGAGELSLNALTPASGGPRPAEPEFRRALINGLEYRAYVYGRRASQATITDAALAGIAVDRVLAVAESPVRLLELGELVQGRLPIATCPDCAAAVAKAGALAAGAVGYEYAGRVGVAADARHFAADASALEAAEQDLSEADNRPGTVTVSGRPSRMWTHGVKKVLLIRADFPDLPGEPRDGVTPITEDRAVDLFTGTDGVNAFFARSSFGKSSLSIAAAVAGNSPDVTQVLRLPRTAADYAATGDSASLHADARKLAAAAGFAVNGYDRVGVIFSSLKNLPASQITYGGLGNVIGKNFWINGSYNFRVVGHELGHTYGLRHANLWQVAGGDPVSEAGVSLDYGDPFDIMGGGGERTATEDFGPWNKSLLQWIPDEAVAVAEVAGTYRVYRFDDPAADLALPRALKVVRDTTRDYWIGYRRATDSAALDGGAYVVWGYNVNRPGDLLDLNTPGNSPADAPLALGATFDDAAAGVTLKPVAQGGSGAQEWLDVQVALRPRILWVESRVLADEQRGTVRLRLRRLSNSAGAVSVAYATEPGSALAALDYTSAAGTVTWASGDMEDKFVDVALVADALLEDSETFAVRLGAVTGGVRIGPAAAEVTVAEAGARDEAFAPDFINSTVHRVLAQPDGSLIVAGAFTLLQDAAFTRFEFGRVARLKVDGGIDPDFDPGAGANDAVRALARQADGRILVGGQFTAFAGEPAGRIVRLNTDGTLDASFAPGAGANDTVHEIVVQPDGRILVGGQFTRFGATARNRLVRLNPDGSVDASFADPKYTGFSVRSIALQPDGKVLVAGGFSYSGLPGVGFKSGVVRLGPDGVRDASFDVGFGAHTSSANNMTTTVTRVAVLPDGRVLVAGFFTGFGGLSGESRRYLARLSATGAVDASFTPIPAADTGDGTVHALLPLPDGSTLIGGDFTRVDGMPARHVARIRADGGVDAAFSLAGGHSASVLDMALQADGRVMLSGHPVAVAGVLVEPALWRAVSGLPASAGTVEFTADTYVGREGASARLMVSRTGGAFGAIQVGYATARGTTSDTASASVDYTPAAGSLAWADGDISPKTILIPLANDGAAEADETFTVRLGEGVIGGASLGARRETMATILPPGLEAQAITFAPPADRVFSLAPISLVATASSGLPVAFGIVSGPATVSGDRITFTGLGLVTVRATQAGNASFSPASAVERSFTVWPASQEIVFPAIANRTLTSGAFTLAATASSGLAVSFDVESGPATLNGATLTPTGPGTVTVRARQAGDGRFLPAVAVERSFMVAPAATVQLSGLAQTYSGSSRIVGVATTPADLVVDVTYDGSSTPPLHAGYYAVVATIDDSRGVGTATGTLVVAPAPLTIKADNKFKLPGAPMPALTLSYTGLVGGDTADTLDRLPTPATTATAKSKVGVYPITLTGGADADYAITLSPPGALSVTSLAGGYEAELVAPAGASEPIGKLEVTADAKNTGFTAVLNLASEGAALSVKGGVAPATGFDGAKGEGSVKKALTKTTFTLYRLEIELRPQALAARVYRDGVLVAVGSGPALRVLASGQAVGWAGVYTAPFVAAPISESDARPFPAGAGHATATVAANGTLTLKGALADGRSLSATLKNGVAPAGGNYRLFARPYGARAQSYIAGGWAGPATAPEGFALPALPASGLPGGWFWRKSAKATPTTVENYGTGFALAGDTALYPWAKPLAKTKTAEAITLAQRLRLPANSTFEIEHAGVNLGARGVSLPTVAAITTKNVALVPGDAAANPAKWTAKFTPASGAFSGGFTLSDVVVVPGKPNKTVTRAVKFAGVLRQPPAGSDDEELVGLGYFLVPPLEAGGEELSGEIRFVSPPPSE